MVERCSCVSEQNVVVVLTGRWARVEKIGGPKIKLKKMFRGCMALQS